MQWKSKSVAVAKQKKELQEDVEKNRNFIRLLTTGTENVLSQTHISIICRVCARESKRNGEKMCEKFQCVKIYIRYFQRSMCIHISNSTHRKTQGLLHDL